MNINSHKLLAEYLADSFLQDASGVNRKLFKLGCCEPDKNLATYLKGSMHGQWFRGHSWHSSRKSILLSGSRLEHKSSFSVSDFYRLGRLIHYAADAFTYAHNAHYPDNLREHRIYEQNLEVTISAALKSSFYLRDHMFSNFHTMIQGLRLRYLLTGSGLETDTAFIKSVCCQIMLHFANQIAAA